MALFANFSVMRALSKFSAISSLSLFRHFNHELSPHVFVSLSSVLNFSVMHALSLLLFLSSIYLSLCYFFCHRGNLSATFSVMHSLSVLLFLSSVSLCATFSVMRTLSLCYFFCHAHSLSVLLFLSCALSLSATFSVMRTLSLCYFFCHAHSLSLLLFLSCPLSLSANFSVLHSMIFYHAFSLSAIFSVMPTFSLLFFLSCPLSLCYFFCHAHSLSAIFSVMPTLSLLFFSVMPTLSLLFFCHAHSLSAIFSVMPTLSLLSFLSCTLPANFSLLRSLPAAMRTLPLLTFLSCTLSLLTFLSRTLITFLSCALSLSANTCKKLVFIYLLLNATKAASTAAKRTKELGLTVNESVIKPTRDKVKEGTLLNDVGTSMSGFASKLSSAGTKGWQGLSSTLWGGEPKTTLATADTSPGEKTSLLGGGNASPTKGRDPSKNRLLSEDDDSWGSWGAGDWHPGESGSSSSGSSGKLRSPPSEFDPASSSHATTAAAQKKKEMNDLERWLNDSSIDTDSPKLQSKKTPSKKSDFNSDWDDWQVGSAQGSPMSTNTVSSTQSSMSGSKKKVSPKPQQNNINKNRIDWDDMSGWNDDFTGKQKEPLVGNLVDLSTTDSNQIREESGWDNEVWAQESDEDEWQSLDSGQPNTSRLK
ncbi:ARFGAP1 [Acanthosepion pharaonis]|uniref:ARFGAP1 n=1 Tax=Acanthosepion pharaonis TaxID=158019 RepID=A0A812DD72_ACAPH|nr:ARFGAP1 [Sepia pharaonis]